LPAVSTSRCDGRPLEELGFYNPRTDEVRLDEEGIIRRLQQGAQPTDTVAAFSPNRKFSRKSMPSTPNYQELVKFMIEPFLEEPASLRLDIERCKENQRFGCVLPSMMPIKAKFTAGRGRNLQAIRTTLEMAAASAGRSFI
jgi:ribosomal protein S16